MEQKGAINSRKVKAVTSLKEDKYKKYLEIEKKTGLKPSEIYKALLTTMINSYEKTGEIPQFTF